MQLRPQHRDPLDGDGRSEEAQAIRGLWEHLRRAHPAITSNAGWDWIYGGLAMWINVDHGSYEWPVEGVPGTDLEFRAVGEYNYTKSLWALDEILIASATHPRADEAAAWAREFFDRTQQLIDDKFSMKAAAGQPTYVLFADRRITAPPRSSRQDNYHRLRALMLNLETLDRLIG